jgi:iron complex transport system substrate-binding protein
MDSLIGISHECDYPDSVKGLPVCSEPRFDVNGKSIEIDENIKSLLQEALSIYRVKEATIRKLKPDIIITQSQCDVCAVSIKDVRIAIEKAIGINPEIISLSPVCLEDVWNDILELGIVLEKEGIAKDIVENIKSDISIISKRNKNKDPASVGCIEWIEPLMFAGNWVPEIIQIVGGISLFGVVGEHSNWSKYEELYQHDPDKIIFMPCGYDMNKIKAELSNLTHDVNWNSLKAVKANEVYLTDGNQYFNRPGPRLLDSIKIMDDIINDTNVYNFKNHGWIRLSEN